MDDLENGGRDLSDVEEQEREARRVRREVRRQRREERARRKELRKQEEWDEEQQEAGGAGLDSREPSDVRSGRGGAAGGGSGDQIELVTINDLSRQPQKFRDMERSESESSFDDLDGGQAFLEGKEEDRLSKEPWTARRVGLMLWDAWGTFLFLALWITLLVVGGVMFWHDLSWKAWVTLVVIFMCITVLVKDLFAPHIVMLFSMTALMAMNVITVKDALSGFSDNGLITIAVLFVVAKTIELNKVVHLLTRYILRNPKTVLEAQARLLIPIVAMSTFLNNTPIVAMMIPAVENWSSRSGISRSKLMLPLSFATVMGGVCSIIGTSTNIVVQNIATNKVPDLRIGFFEVGMVGLPVAAAGLLYIFATSRFLLPDRKSVTENYLNNPREYTITVVIKKGSAVVGKSIEDAGLRNLEGAFLFRIDRRGETIPAPDPKTVLEVGDCLFFAGVAEAMKEILTEEGFVPSTPHTNKLSGNRKHRYLVEAVIAPHSPLVGVSVLKSQFRKRYNAAIIAVHRRGQRVEMNIADIVFQGGDTLLIEASNTFLKYHRHDQDFALVNQLTTKNVRSVVPLWRTIFVMLVTIAMIVVSTLEVMQLVSAALIASCIFIATGCISITQAANSIKGDIIVLIATAFGLGLALEKTGAALAVSNTLFGFMLKGGSIALLFGIYILTVLLTAVFSNAGTVVLIFPLAYQFVESGVISIKALVFVLMIGGSCSFLTPIGYQTDMMVMGPGGYTFTDYVRLGVPLTFICCFVAVPCIYFIWPV